MKKLTSFILTFGIIFFLLPHNLQAEFRRDSIGQKEFQVFQKRMQDSIAMISNRVNMGNETLKAAKEHSENANNFMGNMITWVGGILGIIALLFGIWIVSFLKKIKTESRSLVEAKFNSERESLNRIIDSEKEILASRANASILVLHDNNASRSDTSHNNFHKIKDLILFQFSNKNEILLENFNELFDESDNAISFDQFLKNTSYPKIILMNDDLFENYIVDKNARFKKINTSTDAQLNNFLNIIKSQSIGFASLGQLDLKDLDLPYVAFANEPYSLYNNLNNLLKYMIAENKFQKNKKV